MKKYNFSFSGFQAILLLLMLASARSAVAQSSIPILTLNTEMHTGNILKISADASGRYVLTGSLDKTAKLWDAESGRLLKTFRIPIGRANEGILVGSAISPDGETVVLGGHTGYEWDNSISVYVFDVASGNMRHRIKGFPDAPLDIAFSPTGEFVVMALASGHGIRVYNTKTWSLKRSFTDYGAECKSVAFDQTGRLATVCYDGKIRLYSATFEKEGEVKVPGDKKPASISFTPDGSLLAVGYRDSDQIQVYDGRSLKLRFAPDITGTNLNDGRVVMVSFSADGEKLAAGYSYKKRSEGKAWFQIRIWSEKGRGAHRDYPAGRFGIMDIKSLPDNSYLFSGGLPDIGRIGIDGSFVFNRVAETFAFVSIDENNTYSIKDKAGFKINSDGSVIGVTPFGGKPLTFSVQERRLNPLEYVAGSSPVDDHAGIKLTEWTASRTPKINLKSTSFLEPNERALSVDISSDGSRVVFGSDFNIYCTDAKGKLHWKSLGQSAANSVNISDDGKVVLAGMGDGTLRWYSMEDGSLLFSLFIHPDNKRWVLWSPDGYFDASQGADELIGWHVNQGSDKEALYYPAAQFFEKFYIPNLGARLLTGEEITASDVDITNFKLPPLLAITYPGVAVRGFKSVSSMLSSEERTIEVTVDITDQGGGVDELLLYNNGKLIQTTGKGLKPEERKGATLTQTFTISLADGENIIRATAFNNQRTEAIPAELRIGYSGVPSAKPDLWLVVIGVNEYKNPKYNLNFAIADAEGFKAAIEQGSTSMVGRINTVFLGNAEATRTRILEEMGEIGSKAKEEDLFIFYYAGHGVMSEEQIPQFYIIPTDVVKLYGDDHGLQKSAISASELKQLSVKIKSRKQIFILDACQSGGVTGMLAARGAAEEKAVNQLARSTGTYWLAASGSEQFAGEFAQLGHGVFTFCLLEGLTGKADGQSDRKVTVQELSAYLNDRVPLVSKQYKGSAQYPNTFGYGQDFPVIVIK